MEISIGETIETITINLDKFREEVVKDLDIKRAMFASIYELKNDDLFKVRVEHIYMWTDWKDIFNQMNKYPLLNEAKFTIKNVTVEGWICLKPSYIEGNKLKVDVSIHPYEGVVIANTLMPRPEYAVKQFIAKRAFDYTDKDFAVIDND